jgi:hypothetical protein
VGDPDAGFGLSQPGGWIYDTLPYLEYTNLHDQGAGGTALEKKQAATELCQTPLPLFNCPSRRPPVLRPHNPGTLVGNRPNNPGFDGERCEPIPQIAKSCYAISGGSDWPGYHGGPATLAAAATHSWPVASTTNASGMAFVHTLFRHGSMFDGSSQTYLVGEKSLSPTKYNTWTGGGDSLPMYIGFDPDTVRWAGVNYPLLRDKAGVASFLAFGGPHLGGCQFLFGDLAVRPISYSIAPEIHGYLANRNDQHTFEPPW